MAILSVNERGEGRGGRKGQKGEVTYRRVFIVITKSKSDGPQVVMNAVDPNTGTSVPLIGEIYVAGNDLDVNARCIGVDPQEIDGHGSKIWQVNCEYSTKWQDATDDPLLRPTDISFSFAQFQRPVWLDINASAITNSANAYFDPPVEIDDSRPVLTMVRNESWFSTSLAIDYQDAVNSDIFFGFPVRTVKIAGISGQNAVENGIQFVKVTYEFHIRRELWIPLKILDAGMQDKNRNTTIPGTSGQIAVEPWPLNGSGTFLTAPTTTSLLQFRSFTVYKERAFSALALP